MLKSKYIKINIFFNIFLNKYILKKYLKIKTNTVPNSFLMFNEQNNNITPL
jgi:hypothetical protein